MKKFILIFLLCGLSFAQALAQSSKVEMADLMRSNGKIYVVVAVLTTILLGLFAYLFRLERKLNRLEKEIEE